MLTIERVGRGSPHASAVFGMMRTFYRSPAMAHPVSDEVLARLFAEAMAESPRMHLYALLEEAPIGFACVTTYFATEVGGLCVQLEDLYLDDACRGKGHGTRFIGFLKAAYPEARRFRLEVVASNAGAIGLYHRLGFRPMDYRQMSLDLLD